MKKCNRCSVDKPLAEFYKHPKMADGHLGCCKDCHRAAVRVRYLDKITDEQWREGELYRHRVKSQKARDEGRASDAEIIRKSKRDWYLRNREKKNANTQVRRAIISGLLVRQPCEVCGNPDSQGHHEDYSKPLDVRWLCVRHHMDRHLEINRERRREKYANLTPAADED